MILKTICPICQGDTIENFLTRNQVPIRQNTVVSDQHTAYDVPRGDLSLVVCKKCGFVFNAAFDASMPLYGQNYDNAQFFSHAFDDYLTRLVDYLVDERGVRGCHVVEVGCGDGYFLKKVIEKGNNTGTGYDPSYVGPPELLGGKARFIQSYYGPENADVNADIVICRHVIEHVPEPLTLLNAVRLALANSLSAYIFFETPTVEWILRNKTFWDFFYEHCSIFSAQSITTAFGLSGFQIERVATEFGGQYLWVEARVSTDDQAKNIKYDAGSIPQLARQYAVSESKLINFWKKRIQMLAKDGKVAIWGAGAKGVTFANLVDANREHVTCVVDINPRKQGHYISGTGHPIVDFQGLPSFGIDTVIMMNPNYRSEVEKSLRNANLNITLLDLTDEVEKDDEINY